MHYTIGTNSMIVLTKEIYLMHFEKYNLKHCWHTPKINVGINNINNITNLLSNKYAASYKVIRF